MFSSSIPPPSPTVVCACKCVCLLVSRSTLLVRICSSRVLTPPTSTLSTLISTRGSRGDHAHTVMSRSDVSAVGWVHKMGDNFNVEGHEKRWLFRTRRKQRAAIGRFSAIDAGLCLRCWRGLEVGGGFVLVVQCRRSARERKTGIRQQDNNNKHAQLVCLAVWIVEWTGDRVLFCSRGVGREDGLCCGSLVLVVCVV